MSERRWPVRVPVIEPLDFCRGNVFEHTPFDYYRYGEFPRFIRPVGAHGSPMEKTIWVISPTQEEAVNHAIRALKEQSNG